MKKIIVWIVSIAALLVVLFLSLIYFSHNQIDTDFVAIEKYFKQSKIEIIADNFDKLELEFNSMQKDKRLHNNHLAEKFVSNPFTPSSEINKYIENIRYVFKQKIIGVDGISGAGKTTFTDRVAMLIAADKSRVIKAMCVPNTDVEMHKHWIGEYEKGVFYPGKFLKFVENCRNDSLHNYVFLIEDFDKISPQTFFGAEIWSELDNAKYVTEIDGYSKDFSIPENLFIISIFQSGVAATNEFGLEELRRLSRGAPLSFLPDETEFYIYLNEKYHLKTCSKDTFEHIRNIFYFFKKANELIAKKYDNSYMVGQWSGIRKLTDPEKFNDYVQSFLMNVNSFKPQNQLHSSDFDEIIFSIEHNGELYHSNVIYQLFESILSLGIFSELSVGILFAILTALFGWFIFRRKKLFIKKLLLKYQYFIKEYEAGTIDYESARGNLLKMSDDIESYLLKDKINFPEANYLFTINRQYLEKVDQLVQMEKRSKELKAMMQHFMADGKIEKHEFEKLNSYLESIKQGLSISDYEQLKSNISDAYFRSNV